LKRVVLVDCEERPELVTSHYYAASASEPLGLLYLEAFLTSHGVKVDVLRQPLGERDWQTIEACGIVGLSGLTYVWPQMKSLAREVRCRNPEAIIVAGREHATCSPDEVLSETAFDLVIRGEGELGLLALAEGTPFEEIPGAVCRDGVEGLIRVPRGPRLTAGEIRPLRRRADWMINVIPETAPQFPQQAGLVMGRGCAYKCVFCTAPKMWKGYASQGVDAAFQEIATTHEEHGVKSFAFHDLMLNVRIRETEALCRMLLEEGLELSFFGFLSATKAKVNFELLEAAGFHEVGIGIEVPGPERLDLGKKFTLETVRSFFERATEVGIFTKGYTIIGWPWDRDEDELVERYVSALRTIPVNNLRVSFLTPFPGTAAFEQYKPHLAFPLEGNSYRQLTTMEPVLDFGLPPERLIRARDRILRGYFDSHEYDRLVRRQTRHKIVDGMNTTLREWAVSHGLKAA
jgi:radical SAM superfamily enzyme YgiQ (UPF0313 family)